LKEVLFNKTICLDETGRPFISQDDEERIVSANLPIDSKEREEELKKIETKKKLLNMLPKDFEMQAKKYID